MNYFALTHEQKLMVQYNLHHEILNERAEAFALGSFLPLEAYYDAALYQAESAEDFDSCQLIVDTATRYGITLSYYDPQWMDKR